MGFTSDIAWRAGNGPTRPYRSRIHRYTNRASGIVMTAHAASRAMRTTRSAAMLPKIRERRRHSRHAAIAVFADGVPSQHDINEGGTP